MCLAPRCQAPVTAGQSTFEVYLDVGVFIIDGVVVQTSTVTADFV